MTVDPTSTVSIHMSLSEHLAQRVLALIRSEGLAPGSRLPAVKELAERFSVAAPTMREALRRLEVTGMIDIRHGSGIYVLHREGRMMLTNPYVGDLDPDTIVDLLDARLLIEPPLAEAAARSAESVGLAELDNLLQEAEKHLSGGHNSDLTLGEFNMRFHRGIAAMSGNTVLAQVVHSLTELHFKEQLAVLDLYNDRSQDHEQHKVILEALERRDPQRARARMQEHLEDVKDVIEAKLKGGG